MQRSLRCALGALFLVVAVTACGGEEETPPGPTTPARLAVTPGAQALGAGAGPVTFTATGGTGGYRWALAPASGVGTLSAAEGATVTFTPAPSVPAATTGVVTVTSGDETVAVTVTVTPRAIAGRVLTFQQQPVANALVALANADGTFTTTRSSDTGHFTFPSAPATFDLVLHDAANDTYSVYRGLTRTDPVLTPLGVPASPGGPGTQTATITGSVTGSTYPQPALHVTSTAFTSAQLGPVSFPNDDTDAAGAYSLSGSSLHWMSAGTVTGTVHALQVERNADGLPVAYKGYGRLDNVALSNGATLTGRNVPLAPVGSVALSARINLPAGATSTGRTLYAQVGPRGVLTVLRTSSGNTFVVPAPSIPGASLALVLNYDTPHGTGLFLRTGVPADASGLERDALDVPAITAPAAGATGVTRSTAFSWTALAGATHLSEFTPAAAGQPRFVVVTSGTQTTLPDLSALGVALPASASYTWRLTTLAPMANVDAFAQPGGYVGFVYAGLTEPGAREVSYLTNAERTFTTAP